MWPSAGFGMGGEQAAGVLATVKRDGIEARGGEWSESEESDFRSAIVEKYEEEGNPYYSSGRLWDDGVIDPRDTRSVLGLALDVVSKNPPAPYKVGVFRM